jgi:hypothetical protein
MAGISPAAARLRQKPSSRRTIASTGCVPEHNVIDTAAFYPNAIRISVLNAPWRALRNIAATRLRPL